MCLCSHNTEKVVYFLLLDRKLRNPSNDDDEDIKGKSECGNYLCMSILITYSLIRHVNQQKSATLVR